MSLVLIFFGSQRDMIQNIFKMIKHTDRCMILAVKSFPRLDSSRHNNLIPTNHQLTPNLDQIGQLFGFLQRVIIYRVKNETKFQLNVTAGGPGPGARGNYFTADKQINFHFHYYICYTRCTYDKDTIPDSYFSVPF